MKKEDAEFIWSLLPVWVKEYPEGLDPTFYGTLTLEGDREVGKRVRKILFGDDSVTPQKESE